MDKEGGRKKTVEKKKETTKSGGDKGKYALWQKERKGNREKR